MIDDDNLDETTNYSADFLAHGFEVIKYKDDLSFRIEYEEKLNNDGDKIAAVAHTDSYIPYDIRCRLHNFTISLSSLFPMLNIDVLRGKSALDLDLLCLSYQSNTENLWTRNQTEHFFRTKVYTKANVKKYLTQTLCKLKSLMKSTSSYGGWLLIAKENPEYEDSIAITEEKINYKDWFAIAEEKAKIDVLAVKYDIEIDTSEINRRFQDYALAQFGQLSQIIDRGTPVLISRAMEYIHENSSKFVIIVMDGMSEFDWNIISKSFSDIPYEQTAAFAMIPTTTSVSRQCLLSNKYPSQLLEPWKQSKEKAGFIACAKELGYTEEQIGYARGYDAEFNSFVRCGVIIINDVDDLIHAQQQGRLGMFNDITVLANQSKLADATKRFLAAGYDVYITSDHGNTPCTGLGKLMGTGVEVETKSRRMLVLKDFADKETLLEKYGLIEYPKYYLTKDYDYLICDIGDSFDAKGEDVMTHGGITLDEVVVPFIKIKAVQKNG
ncbi:MAG: PglZ domain-containing protein [Paludibacter sp.]|nr:PglZ domain-containing protein [Paludibacter sp.]